LFAGAAMASNFSALAVQVLHPAPPHRGRQCYLVSRRLHLNLSDEAVDVSVIYATETRIYRRADSVSESAGHWQRGNAASWLDFMSNTPPLSSAFGQVIFNGCLKDARLYADADDWSEFNYRNISVESRIYSFTTGQNQATAPTNGQLFSGIPWYNFVSESAVRSSLDKIFITASATRRNTRRTSDS